MPRVGEVVAWSEAEVTIRLLDGQVRRIQAGVLGTLAVHACVHQDATWSVTHMPSGVIVARLTSRVEARLMAERLWTTCREAFSVTEADQARAISAIRQRLDSRVFRWLGECYEAYRMVKET